MNVRVLIVDDEELALSRLARMLGQVEDVEVVGTFADPVRAVDAIARLRPDLALLDVEMPKMDGFDIVEELGRQSDRGQARLPLIAFVTAYPNFALEAFDTGAVDFVCKPVRMPRLQKTIERARSALVAQDAARRLADLRGHLGELREATAHIEEKHFWVRFRGDLLRVRTGDVLWIEAQACYANVHLADRTYLVRNSIGALETQLENEGFVRVHKSALVNVDRIMRIKSSGGHAALELDGGMEVRVGRKYRPVLKTLAD